jgi:hypothetical protein
MEGVREGGREEGRDGRVMICCSNRSPLVTGLKGPEERVKGGDMRISESRWREREERKGE